MHSLVKVRKYTPSTNKLPYTPSMQRSQTSIQQAHTVLCLLYKSFCDAIRCHYPNTGVASVENQVGVSVSGADLLQFFRLVFRQFLFIFVWFIIKAGYIPTHVYHRLCVHVVSRLLEQIWALKAGLQKYIKTVLATLSA